MHLSVLQPPLKFLVKRFEAPPETPRIIFSKQNQTAPSVISDRLRAPPPF